MKVTQLNLSDNFWGAVVVVLITLLTYQKCRKEGSTENYNETYGESKIEIENNYTEEVSNLESSEIDGFMDYEWQDYKKATMEVCKELGLDYAKVSWWGYFETQHGKFQKTKLKNGGYVKGVWQWTPSNRKEFGIPENVDKLPLGEQVRKYGRIYLIKQIGYFGKPNNTYGSYYRFNFCPKYMNADPKTRMVEAEREPLNLKIDEIFGNNDGKLQVWETDAMVNKKIRAAIKNNKKQI